MPAFKENILLKRTNLIVALAQTVIFGYIQIAFDQRLGPIFWSLISIIILLFLDVKSCFFFVLTFSAVSVSVFQILDFFSFTIFSEFSSTIIWGLSCILTAIAFPLKREPIRKEVGVTAFIVSLPIAFLFSRNFEVRIAAFITGWDHTGAHASITRSLLSNNTFHYFPVDYVGSSPKLFHGIVAMYNFDSASGFELMHFVQLLDYFCVLFIVLAIVFLAKPFQNLSGYYLVPILVSSSIFIPFMIPWAIQMGFSTLLMATSLLLCGICCIDKSSRNIKVLSSIFLIIAISHTWTPLILVALFVSASSLRHETVFRVRFFLPIIVMITFSSQPPLSVIFSKGLVTTFGVGDLVFSSLFFWNLLALFFIILFTRTRARGWDPIWFATLGGLISTLVIKLAVSLDPISFPYYSIKLLWVSNFLAIPLILNTLSRKMKSRPLGSSVAAMIFLVINLFFGSMPYGAGSPYKVMFNPPEDLLWQARASKIAVDSLSKQAVLYSSTGYDSRGAQVLNLNGIRTWDAFDGLGSSPKSICEYLLENPETLVIQKQGKGLQCKPINLIIVH